MDDVDVQPGDYSRTPTALPPAPRHVRGSILGSAVRRRGRFYIIIPFLVGIGVAGYTIYLIVMVSLWSFYSVSVPGEVTGVDVEGDGKGSHSYRLQYRYDAEGVSRRNVDKVGVEVYRRFAGAAAADAASRRVTVRHIVIGPAHYAATEFAGPWEDIIFLVLWTGIWNSVFSVFFHAMWIKPYRVRLLYRDGEPTNALIVSKRVARFRTTGDPEWIISYSYLRPGTEVIVDAKMKVGAKESHRVIEGQAVTALRRAGWWTERSTVYECGGYTVDGARTGTRGSARLADTGRG